MPPKPSPAASITKKKAQECDVGRPLVGLLNGYEDFLAALETHKGPPYISFVLY
jgi:hypothetical protein